MTDNKLLPEKYLEEVEIKQKKLIDKLTKMKFHLTYIISKLLNQI